MSSVCAQRARAASAARVCARHSGRIALGALTLLLWLLAFASPALAGPPVHLPLPGDPIGGFPLNHACGTASDSQGDIYVSSAGNDAVEVFDPAGTHLATIADSNGPCGLAVDSNGQLYVSRTVTGEVVKYVPDAYPLTGTPVYGPPTTIDSSANAKGIAVDPTDDRLYVARGDHVASYQYDGTTGRNEVQRVLLYNPTGGTPTGGTFTLSFDPDGAGPQPAQTTDPIPFDPAHPQASPIKAALEALPSIGAGNISVHEGEAPNDYRVAFEYGLGSTNVSQLGTDSSGLTGGLAFADTKVQGLSWDGVIADGGELSDATGVAAYTYSSDPPTRYLSVADNNGDQLKILSGTDLRDLQLTKTIASTPSGQLGFGPAGASLAADPASGHLFVYDDAHTVVDEFEATGGYVSQIDDPAFADAGPTGLAVAPQRDEVQAVEVNASGGTYTLTFQGDPTSPISAGATGDQLKTALESLPSVGSGNVAVHIGGSGGTYFIHFQHSLGAKSLPDLVANASGLTGGSHSVDVSTFAEGTGPGRLYVTAGSSSGARLLAFGPLAPASRTPDPARSFQLDHAQGVAVDSDGNLYVADGVLVRIFDPDGAVIATISGPPNPIKVEVDSHGNVYVYSRGPTPSVTGDESVLLYRPQQPGNPAAGYTEPTTIDGPRLIQGISINPANDHLFVTPGIKEYDSAAHGSGLLNNSFASAILGSGSGTELDAYAATGDIYASDSTTLYVLNPSGTKALARINGSGGHRGPIQRGSIAVDQANGHVLYFDNGREAIEEYEPSGAYLGDFGKFENITRDLQLAIDRSGGPNDGTVYLAFFDHVHALGPLSYGGAPAVETTSADGIGAGNATLHGTVDPGGFAVTDCHFEYETDAQYIADGKTFASATPKPCAESLASIGSGSGAVNVHTDLTNLDPDARYRFRLVASNEFGTGNGAPALFGPPVLTLRPAQPVLYTEATARAAIDPSGSTTTYRVQYGAQGPCDANPCAETPAHSLPGDASTTEVQVPLFGLAEGTTYHFRFLVENGAKSIVGPDQTLTTLSRPAPQQCPNDQLRTGPSVNLPDCRAYELVTPADTRGLVPNGGSTEKEFNSWLVTPIGAEAGNALAFYTEGTLPGFDGTGIRDGYRASRQAGGWSTESYSPTYEQGGANGPSAMGVSADQRFWFWDFHPLEDLGDTIERGRYLRTPTEFQPIGIGSLGTDLRAWGYYVTPGASHIIFATEGPGAKKLEPDAPPDGTGAIYDRSLTGPTQLVSLLPGEQTPAAGQDAVYEGATEDGSAVTFGVGNALYLRKAGATIKVADAPAKFAGITPYASRVFYVNQVGNVDDQPAGLFAFDVDTQTTTQIATASRFVNVAADGSRAYFTSTSQLDPPSGVAGQNNLYVWDGADVRFIGVLAPGDIESGADHQSLSHWTDFIAFGSGISGRGMDPSRSTPDGEVFVFESKANLTSYDAQGHREIYRYDAQAQSLSCISCDPSGTAPSADALLETRGPGARTNATTLLPNLTEDGEAVFFETADPLLPEDANVTKDVYEWKAPGSGACTQPTGCLALISSGHGESDSTLFSMTPDGHDVFISTLDRLIDTDITGSPSIYDARIGGGFASPSVVPPCSGDNCQGNPSPPPTDSFPGSGAPGTGNQGHDRTPIRGSHRKPRHCRKRTQKKSKKCHRRSAQHHARRGGNQ